MSNGYDEKMTYSQMDYLPMGVSMPSYPPPWYYPGYNLGQFPDPSVQFQQSKEEMEQQLNGYKKKRVVFSSQQLKALHARFNRQNNITKPERDWFAASIGLTELQVKIWFQNQRYKARKIGLASKTTTRKSIAESNDSRENSESPEELPVYDKSAETSFSPAQQGLAYDGQSPSRIQSSPPHHPSYYPGYLPPHPSQLFSMGYPYEWNLYSGVSMRVPPTGSPQVGATSE